MERKYKPGEVIDVSTYQEDEDGFIISEIIFRTYGYDRDTANIGTNSVVDAQQELAKKWNEGRKGGGTPPKGPGR